MLYLGADVVAHTLFVGAYLIFTGIPAQGALVHPRKYSPLTAAQYREDLPVLAATITLIRQLVVVIPQMNYFSVPSVHVYELIVGKLDERTAVFRTFAFFA